MVDNEFRPDRPSDVFNVLCKEHELSAEEVEAFDAIVKLMVPSEAEKFLDGAVDDEGVSIPFVEKQGCVDEENGDGLTEDQRHIFELLQRFPGLEEPFMEYAHCLQEYEAWLEEAPTAGLGEIRRDMPAEPLTTDGDFARQNSGDGFPGEAA